MQLIALFVPLAIVASALGASTTSSFTATVTYDNTYDNAGGSMNSVACSNGQNGLAAKFPTFGSLPSFPHIGGAQGVTFNSPNCGSCWSLTYNGKTINVLAIDAAANGFNIAQKALDELTDGHAVELGHVDVTAKQVSPHVCGL